MSPIDHVDVLQVATTIKLCDCPCYAFDNDPGVIVNTDGRFRSNGERSLSYAVAASVKEGPHHDGVRPGLTLQSTSFVAVEWHEQTATQELKPKGSGVKDVCSATVRVLMQVEPRNCGVDTSDGNALDLLNPRIQALGQDMVQQLSDASLYGGYLAMNLDVVGFHAANGVCEGPSNTQFYAKQMDLKRRARHQVEFERCKTMMARGGTRGLDRKCRRELTGVMMTVGLCFVLAGLCCLRIMASCHCGEARTRRERIADKKSAFAPPDIHFELVGSSSPGSAFN